MLIIVLLCISKQLLLIHIPVNVLTRRRVCHPVLTTLFSSFFPVNSQTQRSLFELLFQELQVYISLHVFVDQLNINCEPNCKDSEINLFLVSTSTSSGNNSSLVQSRVTRWWPSSKGQKNLLINKQMESDQAWRRILQRVLSSLGPGIASPATRVIAKRLVHTRSFLSNHTSSTKRKSNLES